MEIFPKEVTPKVYLVAETRVIKENLEEFLYDIGCEDWKLPDTDDASLLVEVMGRLCYMSFGVRLNPNITRIREDSWQYIQNVLASEHGSVAEHPVSNWIFNNVSRVFTHELVRHRVGTAFSQESQRYVRLDQMRYLTPPTIGADPVAYDYYVETMDILQSRINWFIDHFKVDEKPFSEKKILTSEIRSIAPSRVGTSIGFSVNVRELRHILTMRTAEGAEDEIRQVFGQVADVVSSRYPILFADFDRSDTGVWTPKWKKV